MKNLSLTRRTVPLALVASLVSGAASAQQPKAAPPAAAPAPAPPSDAPKPLAESLTGPARTEYDLGKILYRDGDYAGAIVKFQRSYELSKDARLLWNIASCEKNLRHYTRVLRLLDRYVNEGGGLLSAEDKQNTLDIVNAIKPFVTTVTIEVNEPGAKVFVDDVEVGVAPLPEPVAVDMGQRKLRVTKPGFVEYAHTQQFAGATSVTIPVKLLKEVHEGTVTIVAGPTDLISIDGRSVGSGRYSGQLTSGPHALRVTNTGMRSHEAEFLVTDNGSRQIQVKLEPVAKTSLTPWIIGGGAALLVGAVIGGYFLFKPDDPQQTPGTINPGTVPLRFKLGGVR
jgi:hypothetical protein